MKIFGAGVDFNNLSGGLQSLNSGNARTIVNDGAYHNATDPALFFFNTNDWFFIRVGFQMVKGITGGGSYLRLRMVPTGGGLIRPSLPLSLDVNGAIFYAGESFHAPSLPWVFCGGVLCNVQIGGGFTTRWECLSLGSDGDIALNDLTSDLQVFPA